MKPSEWTELVARMRGLWPHAPIPVEAAAVQFPLVEGVAADTATAVVLSFATAGREHPPTGGMIAARALELASPTPEWDQVLVEVEGRVLLPMPAAFEGDCPLKRCDGSGFVEVTTTTAATTTADCECRPSRIRKPSAWSHPLIDEWMTRTRRAAWRDALRGGGGIATFRAQERESYLALRRRSIEDQQLALAGVDRAELEAPRPRRAQLRSGGLRQLDTSSVQSATSPLTPV
jgi:hypothetical protein